MEIVIMLFVLVGGSIAFSAWKKSKSPQGSQSSEDHNDAVTSGGMRKCLTCGYQGEMKTWISNYMAPKLILVAGFVLGYIPGLVFLVIYWGKHKCPSCGTIGKSQQIKELET